ncbi:MAG: diguanylate cyclase [Alphaproteobacteria bacterium]|nr:diguanylate cyclase [Alphaproteobacteria bacterium]
MKTQSLSNFENNTIQTGSALAEPTFDWFGFLKKTTIDKASAKTDKMEMLRTAYRLLETAEQSILEKETRIKKLESLLTTDELTGLSNRRGFYTSFKGELDRTNRGHNEGGLLIMIDLDEFKSINDTYGHPAGDHALKTVGTFLQSQIRAMDVAARIGGDEFIVLFSNTSISKALQRAQTMGRHLNSLHFYWNDQKIKIKASLGLREYKPGDTIDNIIADADKGLYEDKERRKELQPI